MNRMQIGNLRPVPEVLFPNLKAWKAKKIILLSVSSTDDPYTATERWAASTWKSG